MDSVWNTIGVILATGGVMVLGYWAQHYWTGKREVRDARRKYRESVVIPIREALVKVWGDLQWDSYLNITRELEEKEVSEEVAGLKKSMESMRSARAVRIDTEILPKVANITNQDTRKLLEEVFRDAYFFYSVDILPKDKREYVLNELDITIEKMKEKLNLAFQKLEDYVALAD